jgi:hypothetical protein
MISGAFYVMSTQKKAYGSIAGIVLGLLLVTVIAANSQYASAQVTETSKGSQWHNSHCTKNMYNGICDTKKPQVKITLLHKKHTSPVDLKGIASDISGIKSVQIKIDHGPYVSIPFTNGNPVTFDDLLSLNHGTHHIKVKVTDNANNVKTKSKTIKII